MRSHLPAYARRIYVQAFRTGIGLWISWPSHPACTPLCDFCSSGQRFAHSFLQIPPRDGHPCRSANGSPCRVHRRLSLPSKSALPGAPKKAEATSQWPLLRLSKDLWLRTLDTLRNFFTGANGESKIGSLRVT